MATDKNFVVKNGLTINGSEIITSAGNLTNIGTISSGAITSTGINNSSAELIDLDNSTYLILKDPQGSVGIYIGGTGDVNNYYDSNSHFFRAKTGGTNRAVINSSGVDAKSGGFLINGTTVIDSSRNLTNIGTISSGAITTSGEVQLNNNTPILFYNQANSTTLGIKADTSDKLTFRAGGSWDKLTLDGSGNVVVAGTISGTGISTSANLIDLFSNQNGTNELRLDNNRQDLSNVPVSKVSGRNSVEVANMTFYRGSGGSSGYIRFQSKYNNSASLADMFQIGSNTSAYGVDVLSGGYRVAGTTVIDSSGNLTNIGTISSGAITSTGLVTSVGGVVNTNTGSNPFYVTRSGATNQSLKIYVDDASAVFESIQDESLDNYGTFIFAMDGGTTEPFFDVRKGTAASGSKFRVDGSGALQVGSSNTTFLDASRNLTNIGTISSGAITVSTASMNSVTIGEDSTYGGYGVIGFSGTSNGHNRIFGRDDSADGLFLASATGRGVFIRTNGAGSDTFSFTSGGDFQVAGSTIISSAGAITSGAITSSGYLRTSGSGIFGNMSDEWQTANALRGGNFSADIGNDTTVLKLFPASLYDESSNIRAANDYSTGIAFMHLDPNNSTWGTAYAGAQAWIGLKLENTTGQEFDSFVIATNSSSTAGSMPTERLKISSTGAATFTGSITTTGLDLNGSANISGSLTMSGNHIYMNNYNIYDINTLTFNDPGPNEGISWDGGNTRIYESPDDLTTNSAGNLQFVYGSTRRLTVNSTGIDVNNTITTTYVDAETLKANDSGATPGSCKLHVGSVLSAGSSAVAQLGGFIRMSDQLIIHSGTSANTVFVKYSGGNIDLTEGEGSGANPATIVNDLRSTARGNGWEDQVNLISSDGTNKWNLLVDNGASDYLRFGYNSTDQINFRPDGTIQCDKLIANEAASEFFVAGSASAQTIVAVLGSTSTRPTLLFSESTSTAITGGMSIEYDGRGSGDTNYMAINSVSGANVFKVYSGGDVHLKSGARLFFNGTSNYGIGAGGHNYNSGYFDTVESGLSTDPLELVYYQGRGVNIGSGASKNLGAAAIKLGGVDNTVESGYMLHLESTGDAAILLEADTDNVTESDNPKIRFRQDGGAVEAQIMLTSNNDFMIDHIYTANNILFSFNGSTKGTMTNAGNLTMTGNVTAYSDERLKTNIETLDPKKTLQMRGVSFEKEGVQGSGVIAQELEEVAPELVLTNDDEMKTKSVAYGNLVGYLIETIKEQQKDIDKLKEQVSSLTPKN